MLLFYPIPAHPESAVRRSSGRTRRQFGSLAVNGGQAAPAAAKPSPRDARRPLALSPCQVRAAPPHAVNYPTPRQSRKRELSPASAPGCDLRHWAARGEASIRLFWGESLDYLPLLPDLPRLG